MMIEQCYYVFLIVYLLLCTSSLGEILVDLRYPSREVKPNDKVELTCNMHYPQTKDAVDHCALWWSRPGNSLAGVRQVLMTSEEVSIAVKHNTQKQPISSVLSIDKMAASWEGRYSCHVWCSTLMETGTITVTMDNSGGFEDILGDRASVTGAILTILAILLICIASCCCVALEFCKRHRLNRNRDLESEQDILYDNQSTGSSQSSLSDAPPRYSLVVVSSRGHDGVRITPTDNAINNMQPSSPDYRNSQLLNAIVQQDNINGLFVIPSPPPNYRQALMDLAEKGIIFNPEGLRPPPPAYEDLEEIDLNDSVHSATSTNSSPI